MTTTCEYEKQAVDFLEKTGSKLEIEYVRYDFKFINDSHKRDIYKVTLSRRDRAYTFEFGQSIVNSRHYYDKAYKLPIYEAREYFEMGTKKIFKDRLFSFLSVRFTDDKNLKKAGVLRDGKKPNAYGILACLLKYDVGTIDDFINEFGYEIKCYKDMKNLEDNYKAVVDEYNNLMMLYSDEEMEDLGEIN